MEKELHGFLLIVEVGVKPKASCIGGKCCTSELHPGPEKKFGRMCGI